MSTLSAAPADLRGVFAGLLPRTKHIHPIGLLRAMLLGSSREERPEHYPPSLNAIVESAAMDREMYRL